MGRPRVGDARREQIVSAFEVCVVRDGLEATTLEDVAREAGQPRSLVRYFAGNRNDLTRLLLDRLTSRTVEQIQAMQVQSDGSPETYLDLFLEGIFANDRSNRLVVEMWRMAMHSDEVRERVHTLYEGIFRDLAKGLAKAHRGLDAATAFDAIYSAFSLALGMAVLQGMGLSPSDRQSIVKLAGRLALGKQGEIGK